MLLLSSVSFAQDITGVTVTSSADWGVGLPSKGSLASLSCQGLDVNGIIMAGPPPLPRELAGITVWVDGVPAPILGVADGTGFQLVNFQVPQEADLEHTSVEIVIQQHGRLATVSVPVRRSPGEFFRDASGQRGAFQHASDYSPVTTGHPARRGEIVIAYLTGLPRTAPIVPTGEAAPFDPLAVVPQTSIGYYDYVEMFLRSFVSPLYVGLAPGKVGVWQINFRVPEDTPSGDVPVILYYTKCFIFGGGCLGPGTTRSTPALLAVE